MKILAVETSSSRGGVALIDNRTVQAERISTRQRSHAEVIHPFIHEILSETKIELSQIDAFAVGLGPGSFTGIRVAANTISSLAFCLRKPVVAVDSLTQLALQVPQGSKKILAATNAFRGQLYVSLFENSSGRLAQLRPPSALTMAQIAAWIDETTIVCGDGYPLLKDSLTEAQGALIEFSGIEHPDVALLGQIAQSTLEKSFDLGQVFTWESLRPLYLRVSEAEEKLIRE